VAAYLCPLQAASLCREAHRCLPTWAASWCREAQRCANTDADRSIVAFPVLQSRRDAMDNQQVGHSPSGHRVPVVLTSPERIRKKGPLGHFDFLSNQLPQVIRARHFPLYPRILCVSRGWGCVELHHISISFETPSDHPFSTPIKSGKSLRFTLQKTSKKLILNNPEREYLSSYGG